MASSAGQSSASSVVGAAKPPVDVDVALAGQPVAGVADQVAAVGDPVATVGAAVAHGRGLVPLVGQPVALVGPALPLAQGLLPVVVTHGWHTRSRFGGR